MALLSGRRSVASSWSFQGREIASYGRNQLWEKAVILSGENFWTLICGESGCRNQVLLLSLSLPYTVGSLTELNCSRVMGRRKTPGWHPHSEDAERGESSWLPWGSSWQPKNLHGDCVTTRSWKETFPANICCLYSCFSLPQTQWISAFLLIKFLLIDAILDLPQAWMGKTG